MSGTRDHHHRQSFFENELDAWGARYNARREIQERKSRAYDDGPTLTEAQRIKEHLAIAQSLWLSHERISACLSLPCAECGAAKNAHCYADIDGFCRSRFEKALTLAGSAPLQPGELAPMAAAMRNSQLHERQLAEAKRQLAHRHPNRRKFSEGGAR